jgi:hypothetical protein
MDQKRYKAIETTSNLLTAIMENCDLSETDQALILVSYGFAILCNNAPEREQETFAIIDKLNLPDSTEVMVALYKSLT